MVIGASTARVNDLTPDNRINATVRPVTPLACASGALVRRQRYAVR